MSPGHRTLTKLKKEEVGVIAGTDRFHARNSPVIEKKPGGSELG